MISTFTEVFAVPGEGSIIDGIHPETGRSCINGETLEQVQARYPLAVRMPWEDWRQAQIAKQDTPITFTRTTERKYREMLEILPPAAWEGGAFLVGEPYDHSFATGRPRFQMYWQRGEYAYIASSRPVTYAEFKALIQGGRP
jgi:hypothetical protein